MNNPVSVQKVIAQNITKQFALRKVLSHLSFEVERGQSLVITGPNGSGKSTLIKILSGLLRPSRGEVHYITPAGNSSPQQNIHAIGLVSPYLQLYPDLTAREHILLFGQLHGVANPLNRGLQFMHKFGLGGREIDPIKAYSSGMVQRMKYVLALLHEPDVLLVDEPTANLDEEGKGVVQETIATYKRHHIVIIATNESEEITWGDSRVDVTEK